MDIKGLKHFSIFSNYILRLQTRKEGDEEIEGKEGEGRERKGKKEEGRGKQGREGEGRTGEGRGREEKKKEIIYVSTVKIMERSYTD